MRSNPVVELWFYFSRSNQQPTTNNQQPAPTPQHSSTNNSTAHTAAPKAPLPLQHNTMEGEDYFDIDTILAQQETVPLEIARPLARMGFLDPTKKANDLLAGTKVQVPLWMAEILLVR